MYRWCNCSRREWGGIWRRHLSKRRPDRSYTCGESLYYESLSRPRAGHCCSPSSDDRRWRAACLANKRWLFIYLSIYLPHHDTTICSSNITLVQHTITGADVNESTKINWVSNQLLLLGFSLFRTLFDSSLGYSQVTSMNARTYARRHPTKRIRTNQSWIC